MKEPIIVDPKSAGQSGMTYEKLQDEAMIFLAHCGQLTMIEQQQHGMKHQVGVSANECLGMAVRVVAEQSTKIQILADAEEAKS